MGLEAVKASTLSPERVSNGVERAIRGTRDGAMFTAEWYQSLVMEGRVWVANMGTVTTPLTFLTTAANRPDAWLRVPSGVAIIPLTVEVILESAAGTATEIDIRAAFNDIGNGTSSAASVGPVNYSPNNGSGLTSSVTARQLATGDTTAETTPISLHRRCFPLAQASGLVPYEDFWRPAPAPILIGPATLEVFIAATTTQATGFVQMIWAELPATAFS